MLEGLFLFDAEKTELSEVPNLQFGRIMSKCNFDTPDRMVFYSLNTGGESRPQRIGEGIERPAEPFTCFMSPAGKSPPGYLSYTVALLWAESCRASLIRKDRRPMGWP